MDAQRKRNGKPQHKERHVGGHGMRDRGQGEGSRPMRSGRRDGAAETVVRREVKKKKKRALCDVPRSREGAGRQEGGGFISWFVFA